MLTALVALAAAHAAPSTFTITDDAADKKFVIEFRNLGSRPLCLSPASWPNGHGVIPLTSARISVSIGARDFPLDTFFEDFSTTITKVKPRTTATAYLVYGAFKIPAELAPKPKVLHLTPAAVICD